ncbi:helix-turn-helix transcriptional regulator [Jatrophihabitans telluris]|uniref:helix-turn-helix transcriptional regulator n=1 Tax=Jatrophihabitans telluris TaxID=2038343 RepID=UPI0024BF7AA2|nr:helix-turn-helix transcriptional regulator [Jatrophihabitans telluris]
MPVPPQPLVGRAAELAVLVGAIEDAARGDKAAVIVAGDAGVGKTRLLAEVVEIADHNGVASLIGHCLDFGDVGLPYLPVTEAFGRLARHEPELFDAIRDQYPVIERLLPQHRVIGASTAASSVPMDRAELFASVLGALGLIGEARPTLFVVEDAHWADQSSRDLLGFLLARLDSERIALVISYRSDDLHRRHPLRAAVAEWSRRAGVRRLTLEPLTESDSRLLIEQLHPEPLTAAQLQRVLRRADGNAFFTEELLASELDLDQGLDSESLVPTALAELLLLRLERVSDEAKQLARTAAVAGRSVRHRTLAAVSGLAADHLDLALRELIDGQLLQPQGAERYRFRHALLAEAIYDDLLPGERVRLHARFAEVLADSAIPATAAELARHARESHDLVTAVRAGIQAGEEAMRVAAPDEGMRQFETALELLPAARGAEGWDADDPGLDLTELSLRAVEAASAAGHLSRARGLADEALLRLPQTALAEQRARVLMAVGTQAALVEGELDALSATAEALKLVPLEPATELRARLAALRARTLSQLGRDDESARWAEECLLVAERLQRPDLAADARATLAILDRRAGDPDRAADELQRIADQAQQAGELGSELRVRFQLGVLQLGRGDLPAAERDYRRCWERAVETGRPWAAWGIDARCHLALTLFMLGEWDEAERVVDTSGERPPQFAAVKLTAAGFAVRAARGDRGLITDLPALRRRWRQDGVIAIWGLGQVMELHAQSGEPSRALQAYDELLAVIADIWQQPHFMANIRLATVGLGALGTAATTATESERDALLERGRGLHRAGVDAAAPGWTSDRHPGPEANAWLTRLEAEWARLRWLTAVDPPAEAEHLNLWLAAIEQFAGLPYERARCQARFAAVARAAGRTAQAQEALVAASSVAVRLRATPLLSELEALEPRPASRAGSGPHSRPAPDNRQGLPHTGLAALTDREREVLTVLQSGRTNRQIARQLYISEKTVSVHVSNILAKLGVRSRTEAAAVAGREGG